MKILVILTLGLLFSQPAFAIENSNEPRGIDTVMNTEDPYEDFNRAMFDFNMRFNDSIGRPVVNAYQGVLPQPARTGISNFFDNLSTPVSAINCFLQGKAEDGFSEIMRFTINSTFGLFGLLDIAEPAGLSAKDEDFGQTLYHWGFWDNSSYLVMPFIGPFTTRELFGSASDSVYDPVYPYMIDTDTQGRVTLYLVNAIDQYSEAMKFIDDLKNQPDPYIFSREAYLQHRTNLIYDGNPPQPSLDDFNFE